MEAKTFSTKTPCNTQKKLANKIRCQAFTCVEFFISFASKTTWKLLYWLIEPAVYPKKFCCFFSSSSSLNIFICYWCDTSFSYSFQRMYKFPIKRENFFFLFFIFCRIEEELIMVTMTKMETTWNIAHSFG